MTDYNVVTVAILFCGGLLAGTVDAIAGGGGLITVPLLLALGLDPHVALGTNKVQASCGTAMATYNYYQNHLISVEIILKGLFFGFVGASLGAYTAQALSSEFLQRILPYFMVAIFIYCLAVPKLGVIDGKPRVPEPIFYPIAGFALGFYDGFFGPATGSFWVILLVFFLGYNLAKATAYTKVFNLKSNLIAAAWFIAGGNVNYKFALTMACGQVVGGRLGSQLVIRRGARFVRPIFMSVVLLTIIVLFYRNGRGA